MLLDQRAAINAPHLMVGKGYAHSSGGKFVVAWLPVRRHQYRVVHYKEVGISSRQPVALLVVYGVGPRQLNEIIRHPCGGTHLHQLTLHGLKSWIMGVGLVVTSYIQYRVVGSQTRESIDMAVGIVPGKIAVVEPQHMLKTEILL